jgi:hypothetical protein
LEAFAKLQRESTKPSIVQSSSICDAGFVNKNNSVLLEHASMPLLEVNKMQFSSNRPTSINDRDKNHSISLGTGKFVSVSKVESFQEVESYAPQEVATIATDEQNEQEAKTTNRIDATPTSIVDASTLHQRGSGTPPGAMPAVRKLEDDSTIDYVQVILLFLGSSLLLVFESNTRPMRDLVALDLALCPLTHLPTLTLSQSFLCP